MSKTASSPDRMESIIALCKRRGFIFQTSEIYGGLNGFYDYGPLGVELRKNIKDAWWQDMVQRRDDIVGIDSAIIQHPKTWQASGHAANFTDPLVDCKASKNRYRADQLYYAKVCVEGNLIGYISFLEVEHPQEEAEKRAQELKRKKAVQGELDPVIPHTYDEADPSEYVLIPSPATGEPGSLTPPRDFNMMFQTWIGALRDENSAAYLRPETAQGIFTNFKNVVDTGRVKVPFGIAQIGKAFRNEINPRNYIFRSREFEQMEIQYFIPPNEEIWEDWHKKWIEDCKKWFVSIGLPAEKLGEDVHPKAKLAHYAKACTDITFQFPFGEQELQGIAARGNFDLTQHQNTSGRSMEYFDENSKTKYIPHVIEPSLGLDRTLLAVISSAYDEDEIGGEKRTVLRFHPRLAPIKVAVLPLVKNKPELVEIAETLYRKLRFRYPAFYDHSGAIGRRYRRMDEVGTPFCVTVDFETLEGEGTFTIRFRDSTEQKRINEADLWKLLDKEINGSPEE